jgi:hypothetical protein
LEQKDYYSVSDDDEADDLDGFIVNDEEPEQAEESFDGRCLVWNSADGRKCDTAQRLILVPYFLHSNRLVE